ncbi:hypothetical protein PAAG_08147 [Paracoccidioides lutzii Pb01]|uniref:Uncharacterized protein n=1 Tax=Paracoccidioides lutzii (strain ATCC MYA-826 / Pb01) TaxID=502779 RepID=C1HBK6_PARBA|nr:hypothetical protein PAAG_08147 [Paracoccidioides lutzii Pb01]EEH38420.1 hypothetical protein PAAG_08147 [Paracoccidioides lutzii Pb01]
MHNERNKDAWNESANELKCRDTIVIPSSPKQPNIVPFLFWYIMTKPQNTSTEGSWNNLGPKSGLALSTQLRALLRDSQNTNAASKRELPA